MKIYQFVPPLWMVLLISIVTIHFCLLFFVTVVAFQPLQRQPLSPSNPLSRSNEDETWRFHRNFEYHHQQQNHRAENGIDRVHAFAVAALTDGSDQDIDADNNLLDPTKIAEPIPTTNGKDWTSRNTKSEFHNHSNTPQNQQQQQPPPPPSSSSSSYSFKDQIQKCKESVNIIDVIESYQLEQFHRTGNDRAVAICPFHDDHHPSLHMDGTKQIYKCFACQAGGDVIHFVQEYSQLPMNSPLSFIQALQHIQHKFGDGTTSFSKPTSDSMYSKTPENRDLIQKKERILLANTYAALYFANCLKESYAGGARYYLRSVRGLSVPSLQNMMIGFAPDTYYDHRFSTSRGSNNGPLSLVNHLLQSGFTSQEILDSGLAVMRKNHSVVPTTTIDNDTTTVGDTVRQNSTLLMDRFRGRIMVPIVDEFGTNVLGFGGRIIPPPTSNDMTDALPPSSSNFKAAKYLNSPESVVFEKRNILFNQHLAGKSIRTRSKSATLSPLILVEGYMDAISLWEVGVRNVAATMGTAISIEQLDQASKTAGCRGGKIVICFDNDSAGSAAVERLCRNGMLEECIRKNTVSVYVARLPVNITDPADFVETRRKEGTTVQEIASRFCHNVVETAVDWTVWYVQHLISGYDRDAPRSSAGSFSNVFERIANFLASSFSPAERTKVAYEVAGQLSSVLANDRNSSAISLSVRIQLESDLIDLAARLSATKEVLQRRIDAASANTLTTTPQVPITVASFTSGLGPNSIDQGGKLSRNATRKDLKEASQSLTPIKRGMRNENQVRSSDRVAKTLPRRKVPTTRATITRNRAPDFVSVTTHFSGFQFRHQSDMDWLGIQSSKFKKAKSNPLVLGQYHQMDPTAPREKQVYFNSASFNGYQFLTETAMNAGYTTLSFKPDASLIENGLASIVEQDLRRMIESAENSLLRILVNDCGARSVVKNMLIARQAVNFRSDIHWSTSERRWLFELLVHGVDTINDTNQMELRSFLAHHPSAPPGAFSPIVEDPIACQATLVSSDVSSYDLTPGEIADRSASFVALSPMGDNSEKEELSAKLQSTIGTLDIFFEDKTTTNERYIDEDEVIGTRNELAVQETLVSLLWASTSLKSKIIQTELVSYSNSINENQIRQAKKIDDTVTLKEPHMLAGSSRRDDDCNVQLRNMTSSVTSNNDQQLETSFKFDPYQSELLTKLRDNTRILHALKESSDRIALRLLDESSSTGVEGSISQALQLDLASKLDDHLVDFCRHDLFPEPGINDVPYEIELEKMEEEWGDWYNDDYVWTPGESAKASAMIQLPDNLDVSTETDLDRETLDEFFERVDREWSGWDD